MPDYNLGKVYKIECLIDGNDDIYIGSTCEPYLSNRFGGHKKDYKSFNNGSKKYMTSFKLFDLYDLENCVITLLESCSCKTREELKQRERHYITTLQCVNKNIPTRTSKEYYIDNKESTKQYYIDNIDKFIQHRIDNKEASKQYYIDNKDKFNEASKQYYIDNKEATKQYYIDNKDKFKEKNKQYYINKKIISSN